jgi:hypothetical protein
MPEPNPDNAPEYDALERVLTLVAPRAAKARERLAQAEEEIERYAQLELLVRLSMMILENRAVAAIGYTTERSYAQSDPDQPYWELHGTVTMSPDASEDDLSEQEVNVEDELDNLLAGARAALAARVFEVNLGESATLSRGRLEERACAIAAEYHAAAAPA